MALVCLRKWYLDVVTPEGTAAIVYAARLGVAGFTTGYQSVLFSQEGLAPATTTSFRAPAQPRVDGNVLSWDSAALKVEGVWEGLAPGLERTVLQRPAGAVVWQCLQPASRVQFNLGTTTLAGLGYAEVLDVTLAPWDLPIHTLRWGRFVANDAAVVWIDWQGPHTFACVVLDGAEVKAAQVADTALVLGDATLALDRGRVLRDGTLGSTALARLPPRLARTLPGRALSLRETKWLSRGVLSRRGRPDALGWAIHEVVQWPG